MQRKFFILLMALMMLCGVAIAQGDYAPLPMGGPAPYTAVPGALSEDGLHYDDGTLTVRIEKEMVDGVQVYYVYVTIADASQLRTATAGKPQSKTTVPVYAMAQQNHAVLAFNGDYYNYCNDGVIYRSGVRIRSNVNKEKDVLIVDEYADLHIIEDPSKRKIDQYLEEHSIVEAFSFGPALIKDGQRLQFRYQDKNSCGYPTPDERLVVCQLEDAEERNQYLFIVCDGIEAQEDTGLSVRRMTDLAEEKGAIVAYNLDGGTSTALYLCGKRINQMPKDRAVGDILYFATLVPAKE